MEKSVFEVYLPEQAGQFYLSIRQDLVRDFGRAVRHELHGVKVDVSLAPGLQVKDPSKKPKSVTSLDVFRDSAAGALPAITPNVGCLWTGL